MVRRNNTKDKKDVKNVKKYHEEKVITHVREDVVAKRKRRQRNFAYYILSVLVIAILIPFLKKYTNDPSMMVYLTVSLPSILIMYISFNFRKDYNIFSYYTLIYIIIAMLSYYTAMKISIMPYSGYILKLFLLYLIMGYIACEIYLKISTMYKKKKEGEKNIKNRE